MADIFNVSPPAWLVDATRSSEKGLLGGIAGSLVAGGIVAGEKAASENEQRNWFQLLPESINEAKMSFLDPMWRIKLQQTQLGIANTGLQMQEAQQRINMQATEIRNEAEDVQTIPNWLRDHNTPDSRDAALDRPVPKSAKWQRFMQQIDQNDIAADRVKNASTLGKVTFNGLKELSNAVDEISKYDGVKGGVLSSKIAPYAAQGTMPPAEILAEVSVARQDAQAKKLAQDKELIVARGTGVPVGERYRRIADEEDLLAEEARLKGDVEGYQRHKQRADENRANAAPKTSTTEITMEGGVPKVTQTFGAKATSATTSAIQQKDIAYANALKGINDVLAKVRPQDVGVAGVVGESVFDTWVEQFKPGSANRERITNRTALRGLRENLFAALSPERLSGSAFSNRDVDRLKELASNLEASTSYTQFQERLGEIRSMIQERIRTNAAALGEVAPDSVKTLPELKSEYDAQVAAINKSLTEKRLTPEQAQERINALVERIRRATRENFGIDNPFQ